MSVPTTSGAPPVTVGEVEEFLNLKEPRTGSKLTELQLLIDAAVDQVESVCGPLSPRERLERVAVTHGRGLLAGWPALEVTAASTPPQEWAFTTEAAPGTPVVPLPTLTVGGELVMRPVVGGGWVDVTYRVGRDPVPAALRLAVLVIVRHLYATQRGPGPSAGASDADRVPMGFAVPRRAAELMEAHRAPRIGAA